MRSIVLIISFICSTHCLTAQIQLHGADAYDLDGHVFIFKEISGTLNFHQAWEKFDQKEFSSVHSPNGELNLGFVMNIYWIAIPIQNLGKPRQYLTGVGNGSIFELDYYLADSVGKIIQQHSTGDIYPFASRSLPTRHFYFPLSLSVGSKAIIFYKVNMKGNGLFMPLKIISSDYLAKKEFKIYMTYSFFSGFLLFVAFFSFATFFWTRELVYFNYSMYIISYTLFFIADGDLDFQFLYPNFPSLATVTPVIYGLGINFFMLLFMIDFLNLKLTHPRLYRFTKRWTWLLIAEALMIVYAYSLTTAVEWRLIIYIMGSICVLGSWVLQILGIVLRTKERYKPAYIYGIALLCVFVTAMIFVLHSFAIVDLYIPSWLYVPIGFSAEIIILSLALLYSYRFYQTKHQELTIHLANQQIEFSRQLMEVESSEQQRIAQDLHDELGGNLAAIKLNLEVSDFSNKNKVMELVDQAFSTTRTIAHDLMPPEFEDLNLPSILKRYFETLKGQEKLIFRLYTTIADMPFSKREQLLLYRIVLELTNNAARHSGASECTIQILLDGLYLVLMCEDNGHGFEPGRKHGIGLKSINSRINFLNGSLHIDSGVNGTTFLIKIPINPTLVL